MFEQVKNILIQKYTTEIAKYDLLKTQIEEIEQQIKNDNSEEEYQKNLKKLNKKYGIFNKGKEYKKELNNLMVEYDKKLKEFENLYNKNIDIRSQASKINIYVYQKKLEQLNNATKLEDLKMTEDEASKIISEGINNQDALLDDLNVSPLEEVSPGVIVTDDENNQSGSLRDNEEI